ncbi:hypothetical protein J5J83_05815 [Azoarcus sp. L1K30]|uniref:hypothetical protein n=1 Tax=Azoarcus sp. L1K30 TaxID=2820277 RepID=UPI001B83507E|nr:hypothetical protein [Azoarcus sp. L1K30]MBR0565633.1 hypothetical protein [Azoarcus sp. L1K30]
MTSPYFEDLSERYGSELDDLRSDSEGKDVLNKRLREKRQAFKALMPMLEEAPEMVAPAFHGAFGFNDRKLLTRAAEGIPGLGNFPRWKEVAKTLSIAPWALPLVEMCLEEDDGDAFLVTSAVLDWMQTEDIRRPQAATASDEEDDDDTEDLGDAGADWMSDQGFDAVDR